MPNPSLENFPDGPAAAPRGDAIDFSLVLACYCEEPHLFTNVMVIDRYLAATRFTYELIFVEDASPDATKREVTRTAFALNGRGRKTQVLLNEKNLGRGATVQRGMNAARGTYVGYIDVDLENPIDAVLPMLLTLESGTADGVVAKRIYQNTRVSPARALSSTLYRWLVQSVLTLPVADSEAGLKIFVRQKLVEVLPNVRDPAWFWDTEICHQAGLSGMRLADHPIVFVKNPAKKSTVRLLRDSIIYFRTLLAYARRIESTSPPAAAQHRVAQESAANR